MVPPPPPFSDPTPEVLKARTGEMTRRGSPTLHKTRAPQQEVGPKDEREQEVVPRAAPIPDQVQVTGPAAGRSGVHYWQFNIMGVSAEEDAQDRLSIARHTHGLPRQLLWDINPLGTGFLRHLENGDAYLSSM